MKFLEIEKPIFLYLIKERNSERDIPIKIGYSHNPEERLATMQTGNSKTLEIVAQYHIANDEATARREERLIQDLVGYKPADGGREWFKYNNCTLQNVVMPRIEERVKRLNVTMPNKPFDKVAPAFMSKEEHNALQIKLIKYNNRISRNEKLEFFEIADRDTIIARLGAEANLRHEIRHNKFLQKKAKEKARKEKRAKEQRAFLYLCYGMR